MIDANIHNIKEIIVKRYDKHINELGVYYSMTIMLISADNQHTFIHLFSEHDKLSKKEPYDLKFVIPEKAELDTTPILH